MEASSNMKAVLVVAQHKYLGQILNPLLNIERDEISWDKLSYGGLPGGYQTAISWVYCLFCDHAPPADWNFKDPFDSFGSMDREIQMLIFQAMAIRNGFLEVNLKDKPKSNFQQAIEDMSKQMQKNDQKSALKIIKNIEDQ